MRISHFRRRTRREFLREWGIASSAFTLSPFFLDRLASVCQAAGSLTRVYKVNNGDYHANMTKLLDMLGGIGRYISPSDVVVIKANGQWPCQGYTHTGCIKEVIDAILALPGFSGEVLICDDVQNYSLGAGTTGFDAAIGYRDNNWPDHNWDSLAAAYQAQKKPVGTKRWVNSPLWTTPSNLPYFSNWSPANGDGWHRYLFNYGGRPTYLSCPVFQSPVTAGRMIDMKYGVWENGGYTGRPVKAIFMPTLNNHAWENGGGVEDEAGVTSAIKSFFGATEIHGGNCETFNGFYHIHSYCPDNLGQTIGELTGAFINNLYAPVLYITPAMYAGWKNRWQTDGAVATNTVLACANPVTLDYISCRDVISPYASWLNPDNNNNTRSQQLGCNSQGIGTLDPWQFEVMTFDFANPSYSRLDVERKIRDFKAGTATEQDVRNMVQQYMQQPN
jgi:hypothetical protein